MKKIKLYIFFLFIIINFETQADDFTFDEWKKELTKQNAMTSYTSGLDELYVIKGGKSLNVVDEGLTDELNGASKQKLTTAFKKMGRGKLKNRVILQKFIEKVA